MDESKEPEVEQESAVEAERPLSAEERRENLRALLGEKEADKYFDAVPSYDRATGVETSSSSELGPSLVNWKFVGTVAIIFVVVMCVIYVVTTGSSLNVDTIAPTNPAVTPIPLETPTR